MHLTGALGEGEHLELSSLERVLTYIADGIHVDMNHLKKGEVK